jgi:hypothetical protein
MNSQTTSQPQDMTEQAIAQEIAVLEQYIKYLNEEGQVRLWDLKAERDNRGARARYSYCYY